MTVDTGLAAFYLFLRIAALTSFAFTQDVFFVVVCGILEFSLHQVICLHQSHLQRRDINDPPRLYGV